MSSLRETAITEMQDRLERVTVANGFATDAGLNVLIMEHPTFGPGDPDEAIVLMVEEDAPVPEQYEKVITELTFSVQALVKAGTTAPWLKVEAIVADIKRAVELADRTLNGALVARGLVRGPVSPHERSDGSDAVGATVEYRGTMGEGWGNP